MKLSHYYNLVIYEYEAPPPYPSPKGRGVECVIPLSVRKVLCVKLLSIKEDFMSDTPISSESFMCDSVPLSVRENLSVSPQANRFQHSPSPFGEGVGG